MAGFFCIPSQSQVQKSFSDFLLMNPSGQKHSSTYFESPYRPTFSLNLFHGSYVPAKLKSGALQNHVQNEDFFQNVFREFTSSCFHFFVWVGGTCFWVNWDVSEVEQI